MFLLFGLQECADKGFLLSGRVENTNNNLSKKSGLLIKTNSEGLVYSNILRGRLTTDLNQNCRVDNNEKDIWDGSSKRMAVVIKIFNRRSDADGNYALQLDSVVTN